MAEQKPLEPSPSVIPEQTNATRRGFLLAGLGLMLSGCAQSPQVTRLMPGPAWDARPMPTGPDPSAEAGRTESAGPLETVGGTSFAGVLSRSNWATGRPEPRLMNLMTPIRYVTVHHDGMRPFYEDSARAVAQRLESIRRYHRNTLGWGDIGYHFAVDRAGRVWEGRPIQWQGAHVKQHNEGNIGVVALGNFEQQRPTAVQIEAVRRHVRMLMSIYRVPARSLYTHQEWPDAATVCPGTNLQRYMQGARRDGVFG